MVKNKVRARLCCTPRSGLSLSLSLSLTDTVHPEGTPGSCWGKDPGSSRLWFDSWVGKISWSWAWQPTSILAWRIPWSEEPGGLQSMGSQSPVQRKRLSTQHTDKVLHAVSSLLKFVLWCSDFFFFPLDGSDCVYGYCLTDSPLYKSIGSRRKITEGERNMIWLLSMGES